MKPKMKRDSTGKRYYEECPKCGYKIEYKKQKLSDNIQISLASFDSYRGQKLTNLISLNKKLTFAIWKIKK